MRNRVIGELVTGTGADGARDWRVELRKRGALVSCEGTHISTWPVLRPVAKDMGSPV